MSKPKEEDGSVERIFSRQRLITLIIGTAIVLLVGLIAVNLFTYVRYGGTMFDRYFEQKEKKSSVAGKLAFDKGTKYYLGIIRGEGHTSKRGNVYYIEQAGGRMIDVSRENVEVRDP